MVGWKPHPTPPEDGRAGETAFPNLFIVSDTVAEGFGIGAVVETAMRVAAHLTE